ncbi:MAG: peptidoglycan-binding protein, partial [Actinomycetota bacterium]|nr:peptidoglycan-binding protein [Actinomycetota bacterium]
MKRLWILRTLCTVVAALVVVAAGVSVTLGLSHRPTTVEAAGVEPGAELPTTRPTTASSTTSTTEPPAVTTTTSTTAPPSEPAIPVGTLRRGDQGPEVLDLQRRLRGLGYWLGSLNDSFGPLTEQAVTAFQKVEGMTPDGVAGPATQAALSAADRPA